MSEGVGANFFGYACSLGHHLKALIKGFHAGSEGGEKERLFIFGCNVFSLGSPIKG
jgi:hypothetical protein